MIDDADRKDPDSNLNVAPQKSAEPADDSSKFSADRVTSGDIACLILRIIGIYLLIQGLPYVSLLVDRRLGLLAPALFAATILLAAGAVLIIYSATIARRLMPPGAVVGTVPSGCGAAQLHAIALSIAGVVIVAQSLPSLASFFVLSFRNANSGPIQRDLMEQIRESWGYLLENGVKCALGFWLFLGSKGLSKWWWNLRHTEFRETQPDKDEI